jgi:membrane-associated phospholipid phosphatase
MPRRARTALIGAAAGVVLLAITYYTSRFVGFVERADVSILRGFVFLGRPRLNVLTNIVASSCDPHQYVFLATIPILVALSRGRRRAAATILLIVLGANETTELIKPLLAAPRPIHAGLGVAAASWPSGHATAAMSLALCAVIAAPARRRPAVAAAMAAFAIAVSYSFLELDWHYPSDVLGGFLVAMTWTLLAVAGLWTWEAWRGAATDRRIPTGVTAPPAAGVWLPELGLGPAPPQDRARLTIGDALTPTVVLLGAVGLLFALIVLAHPHAVVAYAHAHEAFVIGAAAIGALGLLLTSGLSLVLDRS